jgi:hypothetical protein
MILSFKPQFVKPIVFKIKIHTIRVDKHNRWHAGRTIQMATGVRTKKYHNFNTNTGIGEVCTGVQNIYIYWRGTTIIIFIGTQIFVNFNTAGSWADFNGNGYNNLLTLAQNDGFHGIEDFIQWFSTNFYGKIIHWTDLKY